MDRDLVSQHTRTFLAAGALLFALACRPDAPPEPPPEPLPAKSDILLLTIDTLRADHLSSYGYGRPTSPVLDRLAAEGVRFEQPVVQWPKTSPSFASIFTATYPKDNGIVRKVGNPLPCRFKMLAEVLEDQGYSTHAVVANGALASDFYFDQGFDTYIETWKLEQADGGDPNRAEAVTELALGLLDRLREAREKDQPFFLWVHYLDPHFPYSPPEPATDRFQDDELFDPSTKIFIADKPNQQMAGIGQEQVLDGRDDLAFYVARYDAEIAYNDAQMGRLLDEMKARGLMENTLTIFTSDHGESLGEHGYYFDHGRFSFQTCLRVPLIVHFPGVLEPRVDPDPVELLHLAPTVLEAAGVELPDGVWMQGRSLTPRLRGGHTPRPTPVVQGALIASAAQNAQPGQSSQPAQGAVPPDPELPYLAFAEAGWETHNKWQKVVRDRRFKLIYAQTRPEQRWIGGEGVRFTLFDLQNDPEETENVAERFPEDLERLKRHLARWDGAETFPAEVDLTDTTCEDQRTMDSETESLLKSLGYLR